MNVPLYHDCVAAIKSVEDLDLEIKRVESFMRKKQAAALNAKLLSDKIILQEEAKIAENVLLCLRLNYFDLEDAVKKCP